MTRPFDAVVTVLEQLSALYGAPHEKVARKKIDHIDDGACSLIATSPFVLVATADADGRCTVSPRGGAPDSSRFSTGTGWPCRTSPATT